MLDGLAAPPAPIVLDAIGKRYQTTSGPVQAVDSVSFTVRREEFVSLLGPSGCGKSTVLGMIGGLVAPDGGRVLLDGAPCTGPSPEKVALVFQDGGLFPWRTALDNVTFGLELRGVPAARRRPRPARADGARRLRAQVPARAVGGHAPAGGHRARARARHPDLADGRALRCARRADAPAHGRVAGGIRRRTRKTVVFVTHSLQEAIALSDRIVVMTARPGRVKDVIDVALPFPRDLNAPEVTELRATLWEQMREESLKAMGGRPFVPVRI
jgi:NitT/TauT family transport system ATP-binding protein